MNGEENKRHTTLYKSNSGLGINLNRFLCFNQYITIQKVSVFNPLLLLYKSLPLIAQSQETQHRSLSKTQKINTTFLEYYWFYIFECNHQKRYKMNYPEAEPVSSP